MKSNYQATSIPWKADEENTFDTKKQVKSQYVKFRQGVNHKRTNYTWLDWLTVVLPCLTWIRTYNVREMLLNDIIAGISVAIMVVPQAVSYANLAGLPAQFGLYGAFTPVIVYGLVGSSRQLAVGPVAVTSLLLSAGLIKIVDGAEKVEDPNDPGPPGSEEYLIQQDYNKHAIQIAFLVAVMYTSIGIFRLGFLTKFLSHSVISGFTTGAALTIGLSQFKFVTGIPVDRKSKVLYAMLRDYFTQTEEFKWREFIMGMTLIAILLSMKEVSRRVPKLKFLRPLGPITACIIAIAVVLIGDFKNAKCKYNTTEDEEWPACIEVVGEVPSGPPSLTVDKWFPMVDFKKLLPLAIQITLVDFLESLSIANAIALKNGYEIDTNREIIGMGLANFAGAMFNSYSTTGSFSRSAINSDVGAKSNLAGLITGTLVLFTLLLLTGVFQYVPKNVLAAIVISSVIGLLDFKESIFLFKVSKKDFLVWQASFLGTVFFGVEIGLMISIGLALLIVVAESAFPHTAELGRLPGTQVYRNVKQYKEAAYQEGMVLVRLDAPIYFANVLVLKQVVTKYLKRAQERASENGLLPVEWCCIDVSPVSHLDAAGMHGLHDIIDLLKKEGCKLILCNPNAKVASQLQVAGLDTKIGRDNFFVKIHDAVKYVRLLRQQQDGCDTETAKELAAIPGGFSVVQHAAEQREMDHKALEIQVRDQHPAMRAIPLHVPLMTSPKYALARDSEDFDDKLPVADNVTTRSARNNEAGNSGNNSTSDDVSNEVGSPGKYRPKDH